MPQSRMKSPTHVVLRLQQASSDFAFGCNDSREGRITAKHSNRTMLLVILPGHNASQSEGRF